MESWVCEANMGGIKGGNEGEYNPNTLNVYVKFSKE